MNTFIVDDEPLARAFLRRLIEAQGEQVVGEAQDSAEALREIEAVRPDLVFLDIQMPGLSGIQMAVALQSLDTPPLVAFVTGYSEHAVIAFEQNALDYIVKPISPDRLAATLIRARARLSERAGRRLEAPYQKTVPSENETDASPGLMPLSRLPIREDYSVRFIRVEKIMFAVAREKRVVIHTEEGEKRTYYTLTQLGALLPPERFLRIHDSCIVNLDKVEALHSLGSHSYSVRLTNGMQLPVSRSRYPALQLRLGLSALPSP